MRGDDDGAFYDAWYGAANRYTGYARDAERQGKRGTARYHYLRATVYAGVSYRPLYGKPVDPRLVTAFNTQLDSFGKAMALSDRPAEPLDVSLDGHRLTVLFLPGAGASTARRPVVVMNNGYDAAVPDMYFAMGAFAIARGYHVVLVDGPGQGAPLICDGLTLIPDWERVIRPVVDAVVARPDVDPAKVVLQGWSLGGHLALRAAAGESRLAAIVVDPPVWSMLSNVPPASALGVTSEALRRLPEVSDADLAAMQTAIETIPRLKWGLVDRGFWVNGAHDLRDYFRKIAPFTLEGHSDDIRVPVLGTMADADPLARNAEATLARLKAPTTLRKFTAADGAGDHQEQQNRALAETVILDWIDDTLADSSR
ncbi:alpha/beta hydrolase family protein [Streptomyces sp. NPDC057445]|uniref:alpha/beta hydrolase family protein n=1 Tax=Streptomyces sp. NPDC057445 TaxID=3346136 RepID=UPI0036C84F6D